MGTNLRDGPDERSTNVAGHEAAIDRFCGVSIAGSEVTRWVISDVSSGLADVRCYPQSDRDSATSGGR